MALESVAEISDSLKAANGQPPTKNFDFAALREDLKRLRRFQMKFQQYDQALHFDKAGVLPR